MEPKPSWKTSKQAKTDLNIGWEGLKPPPWGSQWESATLKGAVLEG